MADRLESDKCAKFMKALGDPDRLRIVQQLQDGPRSVGDIADKLGEDIANVSHHLQVLRHADLVQTERRGKFIFYSLHPDVIRSRGKTALGVLEFGCCRIELGEAK